MSTQITIRFDDDEMAFIDSHSDNRSAYVKAAVRRERRRRMVEAEIEALSQVPAEVQDDIVAMTAVASRTPLDGD